MYKYSDVFIAVTYHITFPTHKISRNEHSRFLWQQRMRISLRQWSLSRNSIEWKVFIVALTSGHLPSWRELSSLVSDTGPIGSLHEIMSPLTNFKVLSSKDGRNRDYASSGASVCIGILMSDICLCKLHGISSFLNYSDIIYVHIPHSLSDDAIALGTLMILWQQGTQQSTKGG